MLVVHLGCSALYWLPDVRAREVLAPSWEVAGLVLLVVGFSLMRARRWTDRGLTFVLASAVVLTILISFGQGFLKREFARDLVLAIDLSYVWVLVKMLWDAESAGRFFLYMGLVGGGLALVVAAPYLGIRHLRRFAAADRRRQVAFTFGALAYLTVGGALAGVHPPVSAEVASQLSLVWNLKDPLAATARRLEGEASGRALALPAASKASLPPRIYLVVVESYGHVLFSGAPAFDGFSPFLARAGAALAGAGYHARSKFLRAPVFGGGSWMADASLFCGVQIDNQKRYAGLFESEVRCLPSVLKAAGYRTVWAAPSTVEFPASYARVIAFDATYFKRDFSYAGPRFGWSFMPDQLVLDQVHRKEIAPHPAAPLFLSVVLTSSHVPWSAVPPLVDWDEVGDGALYHRVKARQFDNQMVSGRQYESGYLASIEYSLETIRSYLERLPVDDRSLVIVLGDHQPQHPVASRSHDPWWVPIHVLSRDASAVERFAALGYGTGLVPDAPKGEPAPQAALMAELLSAYGAIP